MPPRPSAPPKPLKPSRPSARASTALMNTLVASGARSLKKTEKAVLFNQGERADAIYYIVRGKITSSVISRQGKEGTIALFAAGDFVGEACLTSQPLYLDSATAATDCDLLTLSSAEMRVVLRNHRSAAEYFTNFLLQRTLDVQAELIDHLFNSTEKRLARVLLLLANFGEEGKLQPIASVTQELLAQRVGTTRGRISYFMNKFRRLGLIDYNGTIKVHSGLLNVVLQDTRLKQEGSDSPSL